MTQPDYPLMVLPGYEMYQVAHLATYVADALSRHRAATTDGQRAAATRDLAAGRSALERYAPDAPPPMALDGPTFHAARSLAVGTRWAEIVSLSPLGQPGWAVIGSVPGIGPVGARVANHAVAAAVRQHLLSQPATELMAWAITDRVHPAPPARPDLIGVVAALNPQRDRDRALALHLSGRDAGLDAAIQQRFAGVELAAPLVVTPPTRQRSVQASSREMCGLGCQVTSAASGNVG